MEEEERGRVRGRVGEGGGSMQRRDGKGEEGRGWENRGGGGMEEEVIQIPYSYIIKCMHSYLHRKKMCT